MPNHSPDSSADFQETSPAPSEPPPGPPQLPVVQFRYCTCDWPSVRLDFFGHYRCRDCGKRILAHQPR